MLELQVQASLLEKVIESIEHYIYVDDAVNFDCSASGISLQFIDNGLMAIVELLLHAKDFEHYRCDTNISMGINIANMEKIIKCAGSDDNVTLLAADGSDTITFMIKNPDQGKIADFEMELMDIDNEHPILPKAENLATVRMPSAQLAKIFRDLSSFGDYVVISMSNEGAKFSTSGDTGVGGNIVLTENTVADKPEDDTIIEIMEPVSSTFSLSYMNYITKSTPLSKIVTISLSSPKGRQAVVEYKMSEMSYIRFHLVAEEQIDENESKP